MRSTVVGFRVHEYSETATHTKMRILVALMHNQPVPAINPRNQIFEQKALPPTLLMIPTLNEEEAIGDLVTEARECGFSKILVVDGFSADRTRQVAESAGALVCLQEFGNGKGCAIRTGMRRFLEGDNEVLCIIDGDVTNVPSYVLKMVRATGEGADVVLGSRIRGRRNPHAMGVLTFASNLSVSFLLGAKFRRLFTDVQTGYWAFSRNAVQRLYPLLHSTGFEIELEIFTTSLREKLNVCEVPVGFRTRKGKSKFSFRLRLRNLYYAARYLVS